MDITIEISYYPLVKDYDKPVLEFIESLSGNHNINVSTGAMSSVISGEFESVMRTLNDEMKTFMEKYPSVFNLKIANSCNVGGS